MSGRRRFSKGDQGVANGTGREQEESDVQKANIQKGFQERSDKMRQTPLVRSRKMGTEGGLSDLAHGTTGNSYIIQFLFLLSISVG